MRESVIACLILAIIVGAGVAVRVDASLEPIWLDECHTAWVSAADSFETVAARAADGNQPPLYHGIVWGITLLTGLTPLSLRLVSLIAGTAVLIIAPLWAKSLTNRWSAAVLVAGLIAFDGQFIFYSSEARSYGLVQLLGLLQAISFWSILKQPKGASIKSWIVWTLLTIALLSCHYTSVWILFAEAFIVVIASVAYSSKSFTIGFVLSITTVVAALLSSRANVSIVMNRRSNWSSVSSTEQLWIDIEPWLVHWTIIPVGFAILAASWTYIVGKSNDDTVNARRNKSQWLPWLWIASWAWIGPIGLIVADITQLAPMALVRYSAVSWTAIALLASLCLIYYQKNWAWSVATIILISSLFGNWWVRDLVVARSIQPLRTEDWITAVSDIAEVDSGEPIFQFADVLEDIDALTTREDDRFQQYLLFPTLGADAFRKHRPLIESHRIHPMSTWDPTFSQSQLDSIRKEKGCWLIIRSNLEYALIIPGELESQLGQSIEFKKIPNERMSFSKVHLLRVRLANHGQPDDESSGTE